MEEEGVGDGTGDRKGDEESEDGGGEIEIELGGSRGEDEGGSAGGGGDDVEARFWADAHKNGVDGAEDNETGGVGKDKGAEVLDEVDGAEVDKVKSNVFCGDFFNWEWLLFFSSFV